MRGMITRSMVNAILFPKTQMRMEKKISILY